MKSWAQEEMLTLDLGDQRLNKRCVALLDRLASHPKASIPVAMSDSAAVKATYRFLHNEHFQTDAIAQAHQQTDHTQGPNTFGNLAKRTFGWGCHVWTRECLQRLGCTVPRGLMVSSSL